VRHMGNAQQPSASAPASASASGQAQQRPDPTALANLVAMGFPQDRVVQALVHCDNNMDAALAALLNPQASSATAGRAQQPSSATASQRAEAALARESRARAAESRSQNWRQNSSASRSRNAESSSSGRSGSASAAPRPAVVNGGLGEDEALQRALQMSMGTGPGTSNGAANTTASPNRKRPAPGASRAPASAPSTKGLKRLAKVIAPHAVSMDTLIKIINTILLNPNNPKFRRLKWSNRRVRETIKETPGATDFLKILGFVEELSSQSMVLSEANANEAVLLRGMQLLEAERKGSTYRSAVNAIEFKTVMDAILGRAPDTAEAARRQLHADRLPAIPEEKQGTNTTLRIKLGDQYVTRRFRTDNTLQGVVDFLGSLSSIVPGKLDAREWKLVNTTTFPARDVDLETDRRRTFFALEMWPSAELTLKPMPLDSPRKVMRMGSGVVAKKAFT